MPNPIGSKYKQRKKCEGCFKSFTKDFKHFAKGYCEKCYQRRRKQYQAEWQRKQVDKKLK
jgi:protein-arginine kinase activator protein McsA